MQYITTSFFIITRISRFVRLFRVSNVVKWCRRYFLSRYKNWDKLYKVSVSDFENDFSFVTDCTTSMPCNFDASISEGRQQVSNRWFSCISHQRNMAMKHAFNAVKGTQFDADLSTVKTDGKVG